MLTYNNAIQTFPGVVLAGPFGFAKREFFEIEDDGDREVPQVELLDRQARSARAAPSARARRRSATRR